MSRFKYKAKNLSGEISEGKAEAKDKFDLVRQMKMRGLTVILAEEIGGGKGALRLSNLKKFESIISRVSLHERILFMRNLSGMLEAGLPMSRALNVLERQTRNSRLKKVLNSLGEDISKGNPLSEGMKKFPRVYSSLAVAMTKAGEESGTLPESLKIIGEHLEKTYILRRRVRGALMYPAIVISAMFIIGILMLIYVVPTLSETFKELEIDLPVSTQIVIFISDLFRNYTVFAIIALIALGVLLYFASKTKKGKRTLETIFLHVPLIGFLIKEINAARTARTLSSLLTSGVSMLDAITITRDVIQNSHYWHVIRILAS